MSVMKAIGLAYVAFQAPDLGACESFLRDFGMRASERRDGVLYTRGYGGSPYLHRVTAGEPRFEALGLTARDPVDLTALAAATGQPVQQLDAPGGGWRVCLHDPDGYKIEVVAGQTAVAGSEEEAASGWNMGSSVSRVSRVKRISAGPAHIRRLGHCVLGVSDFRTSEAWYKSLFGFLTSDEVEGEASSTVGAFMRCDLGDEPTDHHAVVLAQRPGPPSYNHAAFEVRDIDDLMAGHDHLARQGRRNFWGVGRHVIGSQVFDYWFDPFGNQVELWTDGDLLTASDAGGRVRAKDLRNVQWGAHFPAA